MVYEDEHHIAFLDRWPTVLAKCLVAPKAHVERVVGDLDGAEFHRLMGVVRLVALAVEDVVAPERTYLLSLGSQQGNAHIHWHVAGLPPGVPYDEQQFHALMAENGVIRQTTPDEQRLGRLIRQAVLARAGGGRAGASRGGQTGLYGEGGSQVSG
ncbi:HIT family protein [Streptomyces sp. NBC_00439]|uniref:HIT family protein n=1 Tax=unclassified Streptomyces TaxID=2593676 RepID=UPI00225C1173|nr:HIT family protein [Streptomyces sp. NBC_00439]MCX5103674.1 HIT family protein [Streptomyces sp. NBC_00439]WSX06182.1 HIT family protein [Streptomyces sp. NBC_00987]